MLFGHIVKADHQLLTDCGAADQNMPVFTVGATHPVLAGAQRIAVVWHIGNAGIPGSTGFAAVVVIRISQSPPVFDRMHLPGAVTKECVPVFVAGNHRIAADQRQRHRRFIEQLAKADFAVAQSGGLLLGGGNVTNDGYIARAHP